MSLESRRASQQLVPKDQPDPEDQIINVEMPAQEEGKPPIENVEEPLVRRLGERSNRLIDILGDQLKRQVTAQT